MAPIRISRTGLTRCPGCKSHIKVADQLKETVCPFCETSLVRPAGPVQALMSRSRGALVAASLLASPGLAACLDDTSGSGSSDAAATDTAGPDGVTDAASDILIQPAYGEPMDIVPGDGMDTAADTAMDVEVVEDVGPVDLYGTPPDAFAPEYGMPPADAE